MTIKSTTKNLAALCFAASLLPISVACAATVDVDANQILVISGTGQVDALTATEIEPGRVIVASDNEIPVTVGAGCSQTIDGDADCSGIVGLSISLKEKDDEVTVDGSLPATIHGGGGDDTIVGGDGPDFLDGEAGYDNVSGRGGDDTIYGGGGDDWLYGGLGNDELHGEPGNDFIDGGDGEDTLYGDGGDDILLGGRDIDQIDGGTGTNTIQQDPDPPPPLEDVVSYEGFPNEIALDPAVTLAVTAGTLVFNDHAGEDNFIVVQDEPSQPGAVRVTDENGVPFALGPGCVSGGDDSIAICEGAGDIFLSAGAGNDTLDVQIALSASLSGGPGYDRLLGGPGADILDGGPQDDVLDGRGGADILQGGDGDDRLSGGTGLGSDADILFGGDGFDAATYFSHDAPVSVTLDAEFNDGYPAEGDYVALDIESGTSNHVSDVPVFSEDDELLVSDSGWSGSGPLFDITTRGEVQVVGLQEVVEGGNCFLKVAARSLGSSTWMSKSLDWRENPPNDGSAPQCFWDSHGRIRIAIGPAGFLHVAGPMHSSSMRYWRSDGSILDDPGQVATLKRYPVIDAPGYEEDVTYPTFLRTLDGALTMTYRLGGAQGDLVGARFNPDARTWTRSPATGIFAVEPGASEPQKMYLSSESRDGWIHYFGRVWEGGQTQSRVLFYLRTRDGVTYETAGGDPVSLPVTKASTDARVDWNPYGGIRGHHFGRDGAGNLTLGYSVYDFDEGNGTTPFCADQLSATGLDAVLKARVAVFKDGVWQTKDLKCSELAFETAGPYNLSAGYALGFWIDAPEERILNGARVLIVRTIIQNMGTEWFVLDPDTLATLSQSQSDPGGDPVVIDWSEQCASVPVSSYVPNTDPNWYDSPFPWVVSLDPSAGDADSGDFYRLVHEHADTAWNYADWDAPPMPVRVRHLDCLKSE